jgi:hypothetical protein
VKQVQVLEKTVESYSPKDVFFCPEESQFYSQCLEKMLLNDCTPMDTVIEFGAGDGSPVINYLLKNRFAGQIHGYELNPKAYEVARARINQYQLNNQYIIHNTCFFKAATSNLNSNTKYLIANPPYLPASDSNICMPELHGGSDGATITKRLFTVGCDTVLLMISAYSNPVETVEYAREQGYCTADFMISPMPFGYYSSEPKVGSDSEVVIRFNALLAGGCSRG